MYKERLYPNRTVCDVLKEMRELHETRNYSSMLGLIEEVQFLANRMEAGLENKRDYNHYREAAKEELVKYNKLKKEIEQLEEKNDRTKV